ncbi:MAG: hypothetical protein JWO44_2064 [Bacteroidetes bacterium]|nr:hypothetical protein [Bacteroidota bacterium]
MKTLCITILTALFFHLPPMEKNKYTYVAWAIPTRSGQAPLLKTPGRCCFQSISQKTASALCSQ